VGWHREHAQPRRTFSGLDVLVNAAGVYPNHTDLDMEEADWDTVVTTNRAERR
jgi:NADP-dependent 3-hydroxy acid dehydrogenase YdfG